MNCKSCKIDFDPRPDLIAELFGERSEPEEECVRCKERERRKHWLKYELERSGERIDRLLNPLDYEVF